MQQTIPCEHVPDTPEFRALSDIVGLAIDLRYATTDNFVGRDLYSPLDCGWLHRDAATALERSLAWLKVERPDVRMLVLDALRPQRVQEELWESLQGTDLLGYLAHPIRGSVHSFGMAVDITLLDADGNELDMGTGFDDMTEHSHPALEDALCACGELSPAHIAHRRLLRAAMQHGGWRGINSEWWHFDCGDRELIRAHYRRVL